MNRERALTTVWVPLVAAALLIVLTVQVVRGDGIVAADLHVKSWVEANQVHWLYVTADAITDVLSPPVDLLVFGLYAVISRRVRSRDALAVVAVMAAAVIGMKAAVGRPTPLHPSRFFGDFPSGHTAGLLICAGAAILLTQLAPRRRSQLMAAALTMTIVLAASLVYVDAHWLSDTLASLALSTIVLWGVAVTRPATGRRSPS